MDILNQQNSDEIPSTIEDKPQNEFVTVVSVGSEKDTYENISFNNKIADNQKNGFVTVLTIGDEIVVQPREVIEEVLVYRLPGERLGFGLKFEGGTKTTECVRRLFIQSCAPDSPASRVKCSWGTLSEGDEVLKIDTNSVRNMTRIDCVRCLKDSNVVIKLLIKHCNSPRDDYISDSGTSAFHSDDEISDNNLDSRRAPPPPPIPPRKLSRKLTKEKSSNDIINVDTITKTKTPEEPPKVIYPKSAPRQRQHLDVPPKVPVRDRKLSDVSSGPPDAEVYLDLLSQECEYGFKTESESDDTGSTISTVIDRQNSIFLTSNPSSIASDSIPSTPTAVQKQMDLSKVVNPFEILEMEYAANIQPNDDFLFTRLVTSQEIINYEEVGENKYADCEKVSLVPPANFQDAPLSYGNEDVSSMKDSNDQHYEEFEHKIVEEIKIPKPVPRKCYSKKRQDPEEYSKADDEQQQHQEENNLDAVDFNLPRLVNFVPKVPQKTTDDLDVQANIEEEYNNKMCLIKYNDDFNYMYANDIIECNNNDCEKIISCSTWSLNNHLETIGEIEEEMDSLENCKDGYKTDEKLDINSSNINSHSNDLLSQDIRNDKCRSNNSVIDNGKFINRPAENLLNSPKENCMMMLCENETCHHQSEKEIPIIQLTHDDTEDPIVENKNEMINQNLKTSDQTDAMEVTNFIQSEQQHAIATSEYSSLSSLSSPPLSFSSRLPPDGQEFPSICQETRPPPIENPDSEKMPPPPLPKTEPCVPAAKVTQNPVTPSWVKNQTDITTRSTSLWRKDRNSMGSVKDKIAIFSSGDSSEQHLPSLTKAYKSSENILDDKSSTMYDKNNQISKSCLFVNNITNNLKDTDNKINVKFTSNNKDSDIKLNKDGEVQFGNAKSISNHKTSLNSKPKLHGRSQSMLDMSSLDAAPWNNSDSRRITLNTLIEQRRRGMSKLRGLVIPQTDGPVTEPVLLDLPEIRIKETNLLTKPIGANFNRSQSENTEAPIVPTHQRSNSTSASLQSPSWKNNSISSLPRYSPAFKRKCLQVYVMEQSSSDSNPNYASSQKSSDSVFNSDYENNHNTSLNSIGSSDEKYNEVFRKRSICSDNESCNSVGGESQKIETPLTKSIENITSPSNSEISFEYSYQSTNSTNSLEATIDPRPADLRPSNPKKYTTRNKIDLQRLEDDSDNDSAVSSSQSSYISRECSPLPSPLQEYISSGAADGLTNGLKQKDLYSQGTNGFINASAKCRSGKDYKNGSPLIQRKLNGTEDEKLDIGLPKIVEKEVVEVICTEVIETDQQSTSSGSDVTTPPESIKPIDTIDAPIIAKHEEEAHVPPKITTNIEVITDTKPSKVPASPIIDDEPKSSKPTNPPSVVLRNSTIPLRKHSTEKIERPTSMILTTSSRHDAKKRASVTDIRKQFEQFEMENQKSPTIPTPKPRIAPKVIPNKFNTKTEDVVATSVNTPNKKETKIVAKVEKKPTVTPRNITLPKEELDELLKEVNGAIDKTSIKYVNPGEVNIIQLQREFSGGSIGITLTGGTDYEAKEITVHKVLTGSCAHKDGRLKKGDRILSINGKTMIGLTHKDSVDILKDPKPDKVTLVVSPFKGKTTPVSTSTPKIRKTSSEVSIPEQISPSPTSSTTAATATTNDTSKESALIRVELLKDGTGLGFSLDGGKDSPKGDMPLIIKKIFTGGAAEKCGQLQAGDELIEVNTIEVFKMTRIEVWSMMKKLPDGKVSLTIRR